MARSGHTEAIHHFSVALDLLGKLGEKPGRAAKELELCVKLGPALMMVKGTGSPEVDAIYTRALALDAGEDSSARFKALWGRYYYSMTSGRVSDAASHADALLELAQRLDADDLALEGITRSGQRRFGRVNWQMRTSILTKVYLDTTALSIMLSHSPSVVTILECAPTASGRSTWRSLASLRGQCN